MTYAQGFTEGEHQAYKDRRNKVRRYLPETPPTEYQRGYRDGYTPRTLEWAASGATPAQVWWEERESVV